MMRTIIAAVRGPRSTFVTLDCGHKRSFGGHSWNGRVVDADHLVRFRTMYDCQDGLCANLVGRPGS